MDMCIGDGNKVCLWDYGSDWATGICLQTLVLNCKMMVLHLGKFCMSGSGWCRCALFEYFVRQWEHPLGGDSLKKNQFHREMPWFLDDVYWRCALGAKGMASRKFGRGCIPERGGMQNGEKELLVELKTSFMLASKCEKRAGKMCMKICRWKDSQAK